MRHDEYVIAVHSKGGVIGDPMATCFRGLLCDTERIDAHRKLHGGRKRRPSHQFAAMCPAQCRCTYAGSAALNKLDNVALGEWVLSAQLHFVNTRRV